MGNCQAAGDVVGILVEHQDGRIERLYWSVTARQLMLQYPGNYVALVPAPAAAQEHKAPLHPAHSKLKLLPPDTMLQVGLRYRLVSFEDVLSELSEQKFVGRSSSMMAPRSKRVYSAQTSEFLCHGNDTEDERRGRFRKGSVGVGDPCGAAGTMRSMSFGRSGQWRPALQSISELGR